MSGYLSARLYKFFNGTNWVMNFFTTAIMIPVFIFIVSMVIDVADYFDRELRQIPSSERTNLISLWICFNFPCVAFGQFLGYKSAKIVPAVKPSRLHRPLPGCCKVPIYAHWWFTGTCCSVMTALCVISEVFYLVTSVWRKQYYFMYAYLGISFFIMAYVSSALSVVETYVALSSG